MTLPLGTGGEEPWDKGLLLYSINFSVLYYFFSYVILEL